MQTDHERARDQAGKKADAGKPDWTLLPWKALTEVIRVLEFGAGKYGRNNWQQVADSKRRYTAAAFRHLSAYADGETRDPESGLHHLGHAACCVLFLLWGEL